MSHRISPSLLLYPAVVALLTGCSNNVTSRDAAVSTTQADASMDTYVLEWTADEVRLDPYEVTSTEGVKAVQEWVAAHREGLDAGEIAPRLSITPVPTLFRRRGNEIKIYHLMSHVPDPEDLKTKNKFDQKWIANISNEDLQLLRQVFEDHGKRTDWVPRW